MKFLGQPFHFDDERALDELSENENLVSYDELRQHQEVILTAYNAYREARGNVENVICINLPKTLGKNLSQHYSSPPACLSILKELRKSSLNVCPMCGSFGHGTLDHVFPRAPFSEFSIFTRNLVPACECNIKRKDKYKAGAGERVLHPYFDEILNERLIQANFSGEFPWVTIDLEMCYSGPEEKAVQFHIENIVRKTDILKFLAELWGKITVEPDVILPELGFYPQPISRLNLITVLNAALKRLDREHKTPNNWKSILLSGIIVDSEAVDFLFNHLQSFQYEL